MTTDLSIEVIQNNSYVLRILVHPEDLTLLFCDFSPQIHQSTKNAEKKIKTQTPQCEPYSNPGGDRNNNINVKQDHSHQLFWFEPEKVSQRLMC